MSKFKNEPCSTGIQQVHTYTVVRYNTHIIKVFSPVDLFCGTLTRRIRLIDQTSFFFLFCFTSRHVGLLEE